MVLAVAGQAEVMAGCPAPLRTCLLSSKDESVCYEFGKFLRGCSSGYCHLLMCGLKAQHLLLESYRESQVHSLKLAMGSLVA